MQIKAIILYNAVGKKQTITFKTGAVNIITGKEDTGKSAIIPIIEYCLGNSEFEVPGEIIRATVAWYAVLYQIDDLQVFIAKRAPVNSTYQNQIFYQQGVDLVIPELTQLHPNSDDFTAKQKLLELLHTSSNTGALETSALRSYIETTIDRAIYYLFQDEDTITNKKILFHKQDPIISRTLPYFLGAVEEDFAKLNQDLTTAQRELERYKRQYKERQQIISKTMNDGKNLLEEAKHVGLISAERAPQDISEIISTLKIAIQEPSEPENLPFPRLLDDDRLPQLQREIEELIQKDQEYDDEINTINMYAQDEENYTEAVNEHVARLESINLFEHQQTDWLESNICPLCLSTLQQEIPKAASINHALKQLQENLNIVERNKPRLNVSIERLKRAQEAIRRQLRQKRKILNTIIDERNKRQELMEQIVHADKRVSRVRSRIEYYLETLDLSDQLTMLQKRIAEAEQRVEEYKRQQEGYSLQVSLNSILASINLQMTSWAETLDLQHSGSFYQFDLHKLTVFVGEGRDVTPMQRMGGHKNVLGCHIILYLALHQYFIRKQRPIPHFLILDQPAQGYFPSLETYKEVMEGRQSERADPDFAAVRRMFDFLFDVCEELSPHFQLIILEHANLSDARFQNVMVQGCPWTGEEKNALIPQSWIPQHLRKREREVTSEQQITLDDLE
ncbi:hypothetical protein U27_05695 [Candidatus Vecturithrix granuli]|uniref:DUF3732 domain-containing protein n=1 Tax=Vecturithrix granuli TaxID=1499967 RepID=A0A081C2B5_VECG1|nr:hypothetical protein U27_05695 [Candidatus Vecturithrix granuli]